MATYRMRGKWIWSMAILFTVSFACAFPTAQESVDATPEVITIVVTATEPQPTEAITGGAIAVLKQDLNIRQGPGTAYSVQDQLSGGTTVDIIGKSEDGTWWLVSYAGKSGWVSEPFTDSSNTENVPVVAAPALSGGSPSGGNSGNSSGSDSGSGGGSGNSNSGGNSGSSGSSAPSDSDIKQSVNIKNGNATFTGEISYPDGDNTDNVYIKPDGFDSNKTSGNLVFTLTCSGGTAKVKYTGGSVKSGSPGCNKTWTIFVTNEGADSRVQIYLDSNGYINWTLIVSAGG